MRQRKNPEVGSTGIVSPTVRQMIDRQEGRWIDDSQVDMQIDKQQGKKKGRKAGVKGRKEGRRKEGK